MTSNLPAFGRPVFAGFSLVLCGLLAASGQAQPAADPAAPREAPPATERHTAPTPVADLNDEALIARQHLTTLANPFFEGRAPGTRGNALAAEYLEFQFRKLGLTPAFPAASPAAVPADAGATPPPPATFASYRQTFQQGTVARAARQELTFTPPDHPPLTFAPGLDFNAIGYSGKGEVSAPIVFVGYGITAGEEGYLGFRGDVDLTGKIALLFRFEPMKEDGSSKWSDRGWTGASQLDAKLGACLNRGAAGVILVNPPGAADPRAAVLDDANSLRPLRRGENPYAALPIVMMSREAADRLVRAADAHGRSLLDLRRAADESGEMIALNGSTTLATDVVQEPVRTDNVGAILAGRGDLADQFIVVGAHYDHVGYGLFGSRDPRGRGKLHPGADDNASGTTGMLLVARELAARYAALPPDASARTILFLGFSAEESGLNGSRYYVRNPIVPKEKHQFMLNLDMIGRLTEGKLEVNGTGTADGLEDWIKPYLDQSGLVVASRPGGAGPSDHASFFAWGIPVMFFFTGLHDQYHMPTDTYDLINIDGLVDVADLTARIAFDMARRPETWAFKPDIRARGDDNADPNANPPANPADPNAPADQPIGPARTQVRFGIAPGDYSGSEPGVLIGQVLDGTPAQKAGFKEGDLITHWNGTELKSVEDWMPLLQAGKPGDVVKVKYVRGGQPAEVDVTLEARQGPRRD